MSDGEQVEIRSLGSVLSFHRRRLQESEAGTPTQVIRLGQPVRLLLSHLAGPFLSLSLARHGGTRLLIPALGKHKPVGVYEF